MTYNNRINLTQYINYMKNRKILAKVNMYEETHDQLIKQAYNQRKMIRSMTPENVEEMKSEMLGTNEVIETLEAFKEKNKWYWHDHGKPDADIDYGRLTGDIIKPKI